MDADVMVAKAQAAREGASRASGSTAALSMSFWQGPAAWAFAVELREARTQVAAALAAADKLHLSAQALREAVRRSANPS